MTSLIKKTTIRLLLITSSLVAVDMTAGIIQHPFNDEACPNPKIATMTNFTATFLNSVGPQFLETEYDTS